ncbi:Transmembrane and TPR repeat-containing protein 1 [Folsomia candida]|uniref:Transmembrane and TPR repeat-containing protein 1 n=1 Tax=Folsomia candida TaxID=158441 RepID=A0A226D0D1_FOLCA|nr:Transmembrane and TPR repeat-containing protein 1 [Folsomia candida]OXA38258.1 Transmembrane and TPR repeat-containing protein 1 [Folsomia candida]
MDNLLKRIQQIKKAHLEDPLLLDWKEIYGRILDPTRAVSLRILEDKLRHGELQPYSLINDLVDYDRLTGMSFHSPIRFHMKNYPGKFFGGGDNIKWLREQYSQPKSNFVTVYGLEGMGKSRTVSQFILETSKSIDDLACASLDCINALNFHNDCASFGKYIQDIHKISLPVNLKKLETWKPNNLLGVISNEIYKLAKCKWILILENCQESIIKQYDLLSLLETCRNEVMIVAVIRFKSSELEDKGEARKIDPLSDSEANEYLQSLLRIKIVKPENLNNLKLICAMAHNYPIALEYAASYIRKKNSEISSIPLSLTEFIKLLENSRTSGSNGSETSKQFQNCLSDTLKVVINNMQEKPYAWKLLQILAHLRPQEISIALIKKILPENENNELRPTLAILKQALLISFVDDEDDEFFEVSSAAQPYLKQLCDQNGDALKWLTTFIFSKTDEVSDFSQLELLQFVHIFPQLLQTNNDKEPEHILAVGLSIVKRLEGLTLFREKLCFTEAVHKWCSFSGHKTLKIGMDLSKQYASALTRFRDTDTAMTIYKEMYQGSCEAFGEHAAYSVGILNSIGGIHYYKKEHKAALKCFQKVLDQQRQLYGDSFKGHPKVFITRRNIASAYIELGRFKEAEETLEELIQQRLQPESEYLESVRTLGYYFYKRDLFEKAIDQFRIAVKIKNIDLRRTAQFNLGRCLVRIGTDEATEEGLKILKEVHSYRRECYGNEHKETLKVYKLLPPPESVAKVQPGGVATRNDHDPSSTPLTSKERDRFSQIIYPRDQPNTLLHSYKENKAALKRKQFMEKLYMKKRHRDQLNNFEAPYLLNA